MAPGAVAPLALGGAALLEFPIMRMSVRIRQILDIQEGEGLPVAAMTAYFMVLIFAFLLGRTVRDALFLSRFGLDVLPWMYIGTAVAVGALSQVYGRIAVRLPPRMTGYVLLAGFAGSFFLFRLTLDTSSVWMLSGLYVWVEVFGALALLEFWNIAGEVFDPRQAKRLYALVSSGQVFSNLLCGAVAATLSSAWGVENLLWLLIGALLLLFPMALLLERFRSGRRSPKAVPPRPDRTDPLYRRRADYTLAIGALVAVTFITTSMVDFQFKLAARETFADKDALARFFGIFYGAVGTVGFFLQTFFTGRITRWLGVLETLGIMPGFFMAGSVGFVLVPGLIAATITKFFENTLRYSINDPVTQLLYLPLPAEIRIRALSFASGLVKPGSMAAAGVLMLLLAGFIESHPVILPLAILLLCSFWLAMLVKLKRGYLGAVATGASEGRRLTWSRPVLDANDPLVRETLMRTIAEADPDKMDYALVLAERVDLAGLDALLIGALRKEPRVRARVLRTMEARGDASFSPAIRELLQTEEHAEARAAAVRALGAVQRDRALGILRKEAAAADIAVRTAAIEALVRYGGERGLSIALAEIERMLRASDAGQRRAAIGVVGANPVPYPAQILEGFTEDPDADVARDVLVALGRRADPESRSAVEKALGRPELATTAARALAGFGAEAVEFLTQVVFDPQRDRDVRGAALEGLMTSPAPAARATLLRSIHLLPDRFRAAALAMLWRTAGSDVEALRATPDAEPVALASAAEAAWFHMALLRLRAEGLDTLADAVEDRLRQLELQALRLTAMLDPTPELLALCRAEVLRDKQKRQIVYELLDNMSGTVVTRVREVLEVSNPQRLREIAAAHRPVPSTLDDTIESVADGTWLLACAVWTAAQRGAPAAFIDLPGAAMLMDLVQKVLFLKSAPLFQHLGGEDLEKIASISEERRFAKGSPVFAIGDPGDALYVVTRGSVKVHLGDKEIAVLRERDCFGEMAILDDQPRSASITAVEDVVCLMLRRDDFFALMEDHFEIVRGIIRVLTERLRGNLKPAPQPAAAAAPAK